MTDKVIPSVNGDSDGYIVAQLIEKGAQTSGWVQESSTALLGDNHSSISNTPLNAFGESHSSSSFDVTIDTGEGFVGGAWVARDTTTTVTLSSSTNNQSVYVGWDHTATDTVVIGKSGSFNSDDPKIEIWQFDTDGSGVTSSTSKRQIGQSSSLGQVTTSAGSDFNRFVMTAIQSAVNGSEGNSTNELWRAPGGTSDTVFSMGADGKVSWTYNAYHDGSNWKYIVGSEEAHRIAFTTNGIELYTAGTGTADNNISWNKVRVNTSGDLVDDAGNTIYDLGNNQVPQSRLGGAASNLGTHPIPDSDIDDGSGSGLDADTVDGKHASDIGGSGGPWTNITTLSDTDTSTSLDMDTGTLSTTYDQYKVWLYWENYTGDVETADLRVNGVGTSDYVTGWADFTSSTLGDSGPTTHWQQIAHCNDEQWATSTMVITCPNSPIGSPNNTYPKIEIDPGADPDLANSFTGTLRKDVSVIDQIRFFDVNGSSPAVGKARVSGRDII